MDSRINFKTHVQSIVNKWFKIYGWMVRTLVNRDKTIVLAIYKSLIRPNLEYASSVWNPSAVGQSQILEKVQRKITKLILSKDIPYEKRLEILKLPTLKWRRMFLDMLRVYEVLHMEPELRRQLFTLNSEISDVNLRRHRLALHGESCNSNVLRFHFTNRVLDVWNALPHEIVDIRSYFLFKVKLKQYLLQNSKTNPYKV